MGTATKPEITGRSLPAAKGKAADLKSRSALPVRAAVLGASGYVGRELLTLLARHPKASVVRLISSHLDGKGPFPIDQAHPTLRGRFSVPCLPLNLEGLAGSEVLETVEIGRAHV